jgi:hypothetical protein
MTNSFLESFGLDFEDFDTFGFGTNQAVSAFGASQIINFVADAFNPLA